MTYEFFNKWAPILMEKFIKDFDVSVLDAAAVFGNSGEESGGFLSLQEKKPLVPGSRGEISATLMRELPFNFPTNRKIREYDFTARWNAGEMAKRPRPAQRR